MAKLSRNEARKVKHLRERQKISGTANKPRLSVFKSLQNFYAQLIDDTTGRTLASVSTLEEGKYKGSVAAAAELGKLMGEKISKLKITELVFDRSGYVYHGRVKAFAEAVREHAKGVKF
ncbi:50S ribosomal protein L18 [Mycoplasmopsis maculosa]|uniref:Large ribosomal subunit protein uL18 n=1 Tax=Mycoplasmopsis maculosa TaxID=114885 RepID=A0A449B3G7_9BACT|nr:50S ribosomal protein L18 [Mycoplasmopsis maculosa]VEU75126.1 50S ribosomal protein L18 [Mycoplasmopsis maculosa]